MLQGEHSAILSTFIKLPFVIKIFVLSIYERPFYTGHTVDDITLQLEDSHPSVNPLNIDINEKKIPKSHLFIYVL